MKKKFLNVNPRVLKWGSITFSSRHCLKVLGNKPSPDGIVIECDVVID